jgi:hypothetical protein
MSSGDLGSCLAVLVFIFSIAFAAISRAYCHFRLARLGAPMRAFWVGTPGSLETVVRKLPEDRTRRHLSRLLIASNVAMGVAVLVLIVAAATRTLWFAE